jgi:hypothetical protein
LVLAARPSEVQSLAACPDAIDPDPVLVPDRAAFPDRADVAPSAAQFRPEDLQEHMVLRSLWKKRKDGTRRDAWARRRTEPAAAPAATNAPRNAA